MDSFDFRVVFNTHTPSSLGTRRLFFDNLSGHFRTLGIHAEVNNWNCYTDFDVAVVKSNDGIAGEIRKANPNILIGLVHPSDLTPEVLKETVEADFIISGSLEERDYYLPHNPNIFIMPHIEEDFGLWKTHEEKNEIVLGYHGNKHHLEQFAERLTPALEALGTKYNIRLKAIYNVKDLGRWEIGRPKIPVTDIQWEFSTLGRELLDCDIGLTPALSPISEQMRARAIDLLGINRRNFGDFPNDYIFRFKSSTNAGRAFVFIQLGIPVVADMAPEFCQILHSGRTGYLANSREGWQDAIERLIRNATLRKEMAKEARSFFDTHYNSLDHARDLANEISRLLKGDRSSTYGQRKVVEKPWHKKPSLTNRILKRITFR